MTKEELDMIVDMCRDGSQVANPKEDGYIKTQYANDLSLINNFIVDLNKRKPPPGAKTLEEPVKPYRQVEEFPSLVQKYN